MLVDVTIVPYELEPILILLRNDKDQSSIERLQKGVYLCSHHNFHYEVQEELNDSEYIDWLAPYGIVDNLEQSLDRFYLDDERHFVIVLTKIEKAKLPKSGGWRWHKWGTYYGNQRPQREYIADEREITEVYTFEIYRVNNAV